MFTLHWSLSKQTHVYVHSIGPQQALTTEALTSEVESSMAGSLPLENLLPQNVGVNMELLVAVDHNQLWTMASETVDPIQWSHLPPSREVPPERLVHSINRCSSATTRNPSCNLATFSMWGNHLAYAATQGTYNVQYLQGCWSSVPSSCCFLSVSDFSFITYMWSFDKYYVAILRIFHSHIVDCCMWHRNCWTAE